MGEKGEYVILGCFFALLFLAKRMLLSYFLMQVCIEEGKLAF